MLELIKNKIWNVLKKNEVSLAMIYDRLRYRDQSHANLLLHTDGKLGIATADKGIVKVSNLVEHFSPVSHVGSGRCGQRG